MRRMIWSKPPSLLTLLSFLLELTEMDQEDREGGEMGHEVKDGEQTGKMSSGSEVLSLRKR